MAAKDNPDKWKFVRNQTLPEQIAVDWANKLRGAALHAYESRIKPVIPAGYRGRRAKR